MSNMFETILAKIPKSRSEMVNDLELPDDITVTPNSWSGAEESMMSSDSLVSTNLGDVNPCSSDSSPALSRAMTDSEIDYGRYQRYKTRSLSNPWLQLKSVLDSFPPEYLKSVNSFRSSSNLTDVASRGSTPIRMDKLRNTEELRLKMERFFDEECRVFSPDDPGLIVLEEAIHKLFSNSSSEISTS
ncbi:uncharacterized protein [Battus philenor]|uniref:uncharacterized protein n=1 Tax=Battus philenor TaxID=42288 RepID=UPI0035CF989D